jgi:hypothetical protein
MHSHPSRMIICGVVATVLLSFVCIVLFPEEPKCDGRSLTYWIGALGASDEDEEAHAFAAIEAIGTNGLPLIVSSLGTRDSALQFQFLRLAQRIPFVHPHFTTPHERRQKAKEALRQTERLVKAGKAKFVDWDDAQAILRRRVAKRR